MRLSFRCFIYEFPLIEQRIWMINPPYKKKFCFVGHEWLLSYSASLRGQGKPGDTNFPSLRRAPAGCEVAISSKRPIQNLFIVI